MDSCVRRLRRLIIIVAIAVSLVFSTACNHESNESNISKNETSEETVIVVSEIDLPYTALCGNSIWDLKLFNECLYIGAGDYDKNYTVEQAYRYNINKSIWEECGNIPDEQIGRFLDIDRKLIVPGFDPTSDWSLGNYYELENDSFVTHRVIPNGIHNFDIVKYRDCYFYGLGVPSGNLPVVKEDNQVFSTVSFLNKDGNTLSTNDFREVRAYDLIVLNDELYAFIQLDGQKYVYKYNGDEFVYLSDYTRKIVVGGFGYTPMLDKCVLNDTLYFTTGLLYSTTDMKNLKYISPEGIDYVSDVLVYNNELYILCNTKKDSNNYAVEIFKLNDDASFVSAVYIESKFPSMSFEYDGTTFYIGTGDKNTNERIQNAILCIKWE